MALDAAVLEGNSWRASCNAETDRHYWSSTKWHGRRLWHARRALNRREHGYSTEIGSLLLVAESFAEALFANQVGQDTFDYFATVIDGHADELPSVVVLNLAAAARGNKVGIHRKGKGVLVP